VQVDGGLRDIAALPAGEVQALSAVRRPGHTAIETEALEGYYVIVPRRRRSNPIWAEVGPPKGTLFNYPIKPQHHAEPMTVGWPAPPAIATQIAAN
jgi:hypothetical protein